jgi:hypothetical protein
MFKMLLTIAELLKIVLWPAFAIDWCKLDGQS